MRSANSLTTAMVPVLALALIAFGLNRAQAQFDPATVAGQYMGGGMAFFNAGTPVIDRLDQNWHDRSTWFLHIEWDSTNNGQLDCLDPLTNTCGFGQGIPGLPMDYNPDYNNPATIDPNDPGAFVGDPLALGANPPLLRALTPVVTVHKAFFQAEIGHSASVNIDHDVVLDTRPDLSNGDQQKRSAEFGGFTNNHTSTTTVNYRNGDFITTGGVLIGGEGHDTNTTFNMTSGGRFQVGNGEEPYARTDGSIIPNTNRGARLTVGRDGSNAPAFLNQTAGEVLVSGELIIASQSGTNGSDGTYNLSAGTLAVQNLAPNADDTSFIRLGEGKASLGTFNQTGGEVTVDSEIVIGQHPGLTFFGNVLEDPGSGVYNISTSAGGGGADGDYNSDGTTNAADYTVWLDNLGAAAGTLPNDPNGGAIGQAQYDTWKANFGATGGGGGTVALNQGVGTSNSGADKGAIIVGEGGHGELNIDGSSGNISVNANAILVANRAMTASTPENSTGLVKITGDGATISVADTLMVGDGDATFQYVSASGLSSIDVSGDVDIDGAALIVDLLTSPPPAGDLLLIDVGGLLTGTFASLAEGAVVPGSGGRSISYIFGDGNDIGLVVSSSLATGGAVPEPTSAALLVLSAIGFGCCGNRLR